MDLQARLLGNSAELQISFYSTAEATTSEWSDFHLPRSMEQHYWQCTLGEECACFFHSCETKGLPLLMQLSWAQLTRTVLFLYSSCTGSEQRLFLLWKALAELFMTEFRKKRDSVT